MKLEDLTDCLLGFPADIETNAVRVSKKGDVISIVTECEVSSCRRIAELERQIRILKAQTGLAKSHLETAGNKLCNGSVKDELRHAWSALNKVVEK